MIFIYILATAAAFARFEGDPPVTRPRCDEAQVAACREGHHNAEGACRARAGDLAARLKIIDDDLSRASSRKIDGEAALRKIAASEKMARAEYEFSSTLGKNSSAPGVVLPGKVSLEDAFQLDHFALDWGQKFPLEWQEKLIAQESEIANSRQRMERILSENESDFTALSATRASLESEKNSLNAELLLHARMLDYGCRQQVCPGNF